MVLAHFATCLKHFASCFYPISLTFVLIIDFFKPLNFRTMKKQILIFAFMLSSIWVFSQHNAFYGITAGRVTTGHNNSFFGF